MVLLRLLMWSGLQSLLLHKLRTLLSILGVVFGVASVVSMLAIGEGASRAARDQLLQLGPDRIILRSMRPSETSAKGGDVLVYGLTQNDAERLRQHAPGIAAIATTYELPDKELWYEDRDTDARVVGTTGNFQTIHRLQLTRGRFLVEADVDRKAEVVVLGAAVAQELFGTRDPVGRCLKINACYYHVVGVLRGRLEHGGLLHSPDQSVFMPISTVKSRFEHVARLVEGGAKRFERLDLHQIALRTHPDSHMEHTASLIRRLIGLSHPNGDYEITVPFELLKQIDRSKRIFTTVLGSIGAISLLVGGIGIMNIMLATVTERTREIGIRRALGATRRNITLQFLIESTLLSAIGGVIGVIVGLGVPRIVSSLSDLDTYVTPFSLLISLGIALSVGVLFGVYPANKAARMEPVEAIRHA